MRSTLVIGLILLVSLESSNVVASAFLLPIHCIRTCTRSSSSTSKTTPARHQWTIPSPLSTQRAVIPSILVAGSGSYLQRQHNVLHERRRTSPTSPPTTTTALSALPVAAVVILPSLPKVALACLIPTSLGFYKYEYAVSYGYGLSVATVAGLVLQSLLLHTGGSITTTAASPAVVLAVAHASALIFYGLRLCLFLLYRERFIPRFREMRERIEQRRRGDSTTSSKNRIAARIPLVLGCAALYAGMAAPLWVTTTIASGSPTMTASWLLLNSSIALTWVGFLVAAWGDFQKSWVKARKGEDALVNGGIFALLRHPNYMGEAVGWTASFWASVIAAATSWDAKFIMPLAASFFGWVGIVGVLAMATSGLEKRQREKYGTNPEYDEWIRKSWAGPTLPRK